MIFTEQTQEGSQYSYLTQSQPTVMMIYLVVLYYAISNFVETVQSIFSVSLKWRCSVLVNLPIFRSHFFITFQSGDPTILYFNSLRNPSRPMGHSCLINRGRVFLRVLLRQEGWCCLMSPSRRLSKEPYRKGKTADTRDDMRVILSIP